MAKVIKFPRIARETDTYTVSIGSAKTFKECSLRLAKCLKKMEKAEKCKVSVRSMTYIKQRDNTWICEAEVIGVKFYD